MTKAMFSTDALARTLAREDDAFGHSMAVRLLDSLRVYEGYILVSEADIHRALNNWYPRSHDPAVNASMLWDVLRDVAK